MTLYFQWMLSGKALWITIAPMTVDTFFTLGGILLVYTTAAKMKQGKFECRSIQQSSPSRTFRLYGCWMYGL